MSVIIRNARIIDGNGGVIENGSIEFGEEGIIRVSPELLDGDKVIDGTGKTVIPGLMDAHVHIGMSPTADYTDILKRENETHNAIRHCADMPKFLRYGITTVKNMGSPYDADVYLRDLINAGIIDGPRIIASGRNMGITGGHGNFSARICDTADEARKAARQTCAIGADILKVMATGGILTPNSVAGSPQMTEEQMRAVVEEAHNTNRITGAHCVGYKGTLDAINAGIDSIEHGHYLTDELMDKMIENGQYLCPTIVATRGVFESTVDTPLAEYFRSKIRPIAPMHLEVIAKAIKKGVKIVAGTDVSTLDNPIGTLAKELDWYVKLGMTPMEAIISATRTCAELCHIDKITGTLEKGKCADLVLIEGNPLEDMMDLLKVERTYVKGRLLYARGPEF